MAVPLVRSDVPGFPVRRGKVRDVYDLGDRLVIVATDRISAFDWILPTPIPDKGCILTRLSAFWFHLLGEPNHLLSLNLADMGPEFAAREAQLRGRSMLVKKTQVVPIECVARGYLAGSGWKEYRQSQAVCSISLPAGLRESEKLPAPIFTPAAKEEHGHDLNISFDRMVATVGVGVADELRRRTLSVYQRAAEHALSCGIIIADTKLEWGRLPTGEMILIDEVLTPDSSRFWPQSEYRVGGNPPSFDKQFVRDWLENSGWDKNSRPPELPPDVVIKTREKYVEAFERITGQQFRDD
jgi:phosphoribosylaminoimidazole-succinocarboxamide synthase